LGTRKSIRDQLGKVALAPSNCVQASEHVIRKFDIKRPKVIDVEVVEANSGRYEPGYSTGLPRVTPCLNQREEPLEG